MQDEDENDRSVKTTVNDYGGHNESTYWTRLSLAYEPEDLCL